MIGYKSKKKTVNNDLKKINRFCEVMEEGKFCATFKYIKS